MTRTGNWYEGSSGAPTATAGAPPPRTQSPTPEYTAPYGAAIVAEFLARKQAVLQTILGHFPALPQFIALCVTYCVVFCICIISLILLFVGSFVLTGQDQVVARLRQLMDAGGLGGRAGAAVWWVMRAAIGLAATVTGAATGGDAGRRENGDRTSRNTGRSQSRPSSNPRRSSAQEHWQQPRHERSSASANSRQRASYSGSSTRGFA